MKHLKENCSARHQIIANKCGLACANCGACKCGGETEYYTRQQYLNGEISHEGYYGQFVNVATKAQIRKYIGLERIMASRDPNFNDIGLENWGLNQFVYEKKLLAKCDPCGNSESVKTCIAKEAARQIVREERRKLCTEHS